MIKKSGSMNEPCEVTEDRSESRRFTVRPCFFHSSDSLRATGSMSAHSTHWGTLLSHLWWSVCQRHTVTTWRVTVYHIHPLCTPCQATGLFNLLSFALWGSNKKKNMWHEKQQVSGTVPLVALHVTNDTFTAFDFTSKCSLCMCALMYANYSSTRSLCNREDNKFQQFIKQVSYVFRFSRR